MKQNGCDRSILNLSIDIILLLLLMPMAGIGLMIKYILLPGTERNERYGSDVDLEFMGLTRHEWGSVHLIISIVFLVLLFFHIILHWKMIVCIFGRMVPNKTMRIWTATGLTIVSTLLIAFPLLIKPEIIPRESLHLNRKFKQEILRTVTPEEIPKEAQKEIPKDSVVSLPAQSNKRDHGLTETVFADHEINGSQTLQFIADKYGIPAEKLATDLNIPVERTGERLGRLRRQYGFTMDDVRAGVLKNKK
ncbi:MAG: DUF4405 domain-containing protein [Mangrovibacterium sp.]